MPKHVTSYLKFLVKMRIAAPLRSLWLRFFGAEVNREDWDKRILLINLESLGDLIMFTSVLKHYKARFPGHRVYLLLKAGTSFEKLIGGLVDEVCAVNYRAFAVNPFYGAAFVNRLRRIGFEKVVSHDFSAAEIIGKIIAVEVGAKEVVGYEGMNIESRKPYDVQQEENLEIVKGRLFPRFTKIIPSIDKGTESDMRLRGAISHYRAVYEYVAGVKENDYATTLVMPRGDGDETLKKFGLSRSAYVLFNVNATMFYRRWPLPRFAEVAEFLDIQGISVVLMGAAINIPLTEEFRRMWPKAINLAGKTSLSEYIHLVRESLFVFANDTSVVHLAVALKKPSICIAGGGQFGAFTDYGYPDINHWLWRKTDCYFDDWHCNFGLTPNTPAPCIDAVSVNAALAKVRSLLGYLTANKSYPLERFSSEIEPRKSDEV